MLKVAQNICFAEDKGKLGDDYVVGVVHRGNVDFSEEIKFGFKLITTGLKLWLLTMKRMLVEKAVL